MRWTMSFLIAICAAGYAAAADLPDQHRRSTKPHGRIYDRDVHVEQDPDLLFTPSDGSLPSLPPRIGRPLLPGSATLPGYYGSTHSYDYQGPYYGGPYLGYWNRLPYACGVYGYC